MGRFFSHDNPFWSAMGNIFDIFILNLLWMVCCIPLFTIGPATTAFYYVMLDIVRGESPDVSKRFFHSFRQNFRQAVPLGLILMFIGAFLAGDIYLCRQSGTGIFTFFMFFFGVIFVFWCFVTLYTFPFLSKFDKSNRDILILSFTMSVKYFPRTLCMIAAWVLCIWLCHLLPGLVFIVPGLAAEFQTAMLLPVLKPFLPDDSIDDSDFTEKNPEDTDTEKEDEELPRKPSVFLLEMRRDIDTLKSLTFKEKIGFIYDYYKWYILGAAFIITVICVFAHMLWEGQRPYRLNLCVVLNTDDDCSEWFDSFEDELLSDGKTGAFYINTDQPFDYDNMYYYVQEVEVMTTISSGRMDVAICGEDMYSYLLALNVCLPLDEYLSEDMLYALSENNSLVYSTANLQKDSSGDVDLSQGIDGYFAVNLEGTEFDNLYNSPKASEKEPLYLIIISTSEHLDDSMALLQYMLR